MKQKVVNQNLILSWSGCAFPFSCCVQLLSPSLVLLVSPLSVVSLSVSVGVCGVPIILLLLQSPTSVSHPLIRLWVISAPTLRKLIQCGRPMLQSKAVCSCAIFFLLLFACADLVFPDPLIHSFLPRFHLRTCLALAQLNLSVLLSRGTQDPSLII